MEAILQKQLESRNNILREIITRGKEFITRCSTGVLEDEFIAIKLELKYSIDNFSKAIHFYIDKSQEPSPDLINLTSQTQIEAETLQIQIESIAQWVGMDNKRKITSKLPKLELIKFSGEVLLFSEFWDRFKVTVDSQDISNAEKLSYLLGSLEGNAKEALQGLNATNENYQIAIDVLQKRYGSKSLLIDAHYEAISKIRRASSSPFECRQNLNQIEKHLRILQSLGEDVDNNHLRVAITNKFPDSVIYQLNLTTTIDRDVKTLRESLEKIIIALERSGAGSSTNTLKIEPENGVASAAALHIRMEKRTRSESNPRRNSYPVDKKPKIECGFCNGNHYTDKCRKFSTLRERQARLKGKCYGCFKMGHHFKKCSYKRKCYFCKNFSHSTALCPVKLKEKDKPVTSKAVAGKPVTECPNELAKRAFILNATNNTNKRSFLQTATAKLRNKNKVISCRVLLDSGSQRSYVTTRIATKLNLEPDNESKLLIYTFGSDVPQETSSSSADIMIETKRGILRNIRVNIVPHITKQIPIMKIKNADLVDISADDDSIGTFVDVLIGNDYYFSFMKNEHLKIGEDLFLINTDFGWILSGNTDHYGDDNELYVVTYCQCHDSACPYFSEPDLPLRSIDMKFLWALESIGISDSPKTTREEESVKFFNETTIYKFGRYQVKWPWVQYPPDLPTNFGLAYGRLKNLIQRSDKETLEEYNLILQEQLEANIIEVVGQTDNPINQTTPPVHYLPHHIVRQEGKRGRIVYDASAKLKDHKSLNECLYRGPSMLEDLMALLLKFRTNKIGITADVEKAFLQIGLQQDDKDVTRFLWLKDIDKGLSEDNLLHLRFCRVPFGIISSPFLLTATIRNHIAQTNKNLMKEIADKCYMDNLLTGAPSLERATELFQNTQKIFKQLSMNIREWMSNEEGLMERIPVTLKSKQVDKCKVLGLIWDIKKDSLELNLNEDIFDEDNLQKNNTKRDVLRTLARIFDPHGFAAPLILPVKMLFQELCVLKLKWDKILPDHLLQRWRAILEKLKTAKEIEIPRYLEQGNSSLKKKYELHTFADASKNAYAAVTYVRIISQKHVSSTFLMSKARITPIEDKDNLKIPRLELLACLIGSRLSKYINENIGIPIDRQYLWTDSCVVLSWLKTNKLLPPFVSRRVSEINQHKNMEFCYINTTENPADLATRPELWDQKKDLWFAGPTFLTTDIKHWPFNRHIDAQQTSFFVGETLDTVGDPEMTMKGYETDLPDYLQEDQAMEFHEEETQDESIKKIKEIQLKHFPEEVSGKTTSLSRNLNLFMDINGLLRCKGRMTHTDWNYDTKYPILIPRDSPFTSNTIREIHEKNYHVGVSHSLSLVRLKYWIPQGKAQVQKVLKKCPQCVKHGGGPYTLPVPPALPAERVNYSRPFTYAGIDYFGPMFVETDSGKEKRWVCLLTCLAIRAVHLEIVRDLSAEECLLALRRFSASRGIPQKILSDNALYFKLTSEVLSDPYCRENKIQWKFIPQLAPWHGGFYERLVGLVKHCLKRTLDKHLLKDSQLATIMKEVEAVINSRPLMSVGADLEYVLKPSDFLSIGRCIEVTITDDRNMSGTTTKVDLVESWKRGQTILKEFIKMFQQQYLVSLREKHRYSLKQPRVMANRAPQIGDIVQIKNDNKNRINWKVGKITELISGTDGQCRVAKIKVGSTELTRSIGHLYPLEGDDCTNTEEAVSQDQGCSVEDLPLIMPEVDIHDQSDKESPSLPERVAEEPPPTSQELSDERNENVPEVETINDVEMSDEPELDKKLDTDPEVDSGSPVDNARPKREAAIKARQKIAELTRQLMVYYDTSFSPGSVAELY